MPLRLINAAILVYLVYTTQPVQKTMPSVIPTPEGPRSHESSGELQHEGMNDCNGTALLEEVGKMLLRERKVATVCTGMPLVVITVTILLMLQGAVLTLVIYGLITRNPELTRLENWQEMILGEEHQLDLLPPSYEEAMRDHDNDGL